MGHGVNHPKEIGSAMCGCSTSVPFYPFSFSSLLTFCFFFISFFKIAKVPAPQFFPFLTPAVEIRDGGEPALGTRAVYKNYFFEILIFLKNWVKMKM